MPRIAPLLGVLFVSFATDASAYQLTDSLKDGNPKGTAVGGAYGPGGWTVTGKTDRIYYALPRLVSGSIEFTVSGITTSNLDLADHEIFSMYDAGYGIAEPINYNPEFRDNDYKMLVRIYGQMVPERLGLQKFIMLMCPDGAPGYGACACPKSFYDGDGWWGGNGTWDGSPSKLKVSWGDGKATYSRDGIDVWTNDYTSTGLSFGPSELHFTLGCARHDAIGDAGMPIGATFSDVVVNGTEGPLETCGSGGAGGAGGAGGTGGAGGSGGACDPAAPISAVSLDPVAGAGPSAQLVARYAHCQGASALRVVQLLVGEPQAAAPYIAPSFEGGLLYLGADSCAPGEAKVLTDTLGSLDCSTSSVVPSGNEITVTYALSFDVAKFGGKHPVWFDAKGGTASPEPRLGWTQMGEFTVQSQPGWGGGGNAGGAAGSTFRGDTIAEDDGCGCRLPGGRRAAGELALGALIALAVWRRRRQRRA